MGWTQDISGKTLKQMIHQYTEGMENDNQKVLKRCFRGNPTHSGVLWVVWELNHNSKRTLLIVCNMMQYWSSQGQAGWGVKEVEETCGPTSVTCPLSYLKIASGPDSLEKEVYSAEWRKNVIEYHSRKKQNKRRI